MRFGAAVFALMWVPQIYGGVGNHPVLAWLYVPLLALGRFRVSAVALAFALALVVLELVAPAWPTAEAGLALQTLAVVLWAWQGRLLRESAQPRVADLLRRAHRAARPSFAVAGVALATALLFRNFPAFECALWSITCFAVAWAVPSPARVRWADVVAAVLLTLASTAVGIGILEGGARIAFGRLPGPSDMYAPDPVYIFTLRPNTRGDFRLRDNNGEWVTVEAVISPQGVRDRVLGPKAPDEFRIVMIGDSYTMGHGLKPEENIPHVLETLLNETPLPKKVTVINCGVGGYAPWQERGFLNARGRQFEPDLVILQVFPANDVAGSLSRGTKYLQMPDLEWERRLNNFRRQNEFPARVQRWFEKHSWTYMLLRRAVANPDLLNDALRNLRFVRYKEYPRPVQKVYRNPYREASLVHFYPELEEAYRLLEEDIRGIRDDCRARNVDLVAYAHPFPMATLEDGWEEFDHETEGSLFEPNKDVRLTQEIFARAGIPYVNVTERLESQPDITSLYFRYDGHFTPKGARVVAEALAEFLGREYFPKKFAEYR